MEKEKNRIIVKVLLLLLGLLVISGGCGEKTRTPGQKTAYAENKNPDEAKKMSTEMIVERIKQKDPTVVDQKPEVTPEVAKSIAELLEDEDYQVRKIALEVLNNSPGQPTRRAVIRALRDKNINVRSMAGGMLLLHHDPADLQILIRELSTNKDEFVREQIALTLGIMMEASSIEPLQRQLAMETDPEARHAMHLALTRLKEPENQKQYIERLRQPDPKGKTAAIQDFEYIKDPVFLKDMLPLLDDTHPGLNVGKSNKKIFIRVCDVLINTLDKVLEHPFAFDIFPKAEYTPDEIRQAKDTLRNIIGKY